MPQNLTNRPRFFNNRFLPRYLTELDGQSDISWEALSSTLKRSFQAATKLDPDDHTFRQATDAVRAWSDKIHKLEQSRPRHTVPRFAALEGLPDLVPLAPGSRVLVPGGLFAMALVLDGYAFNDLHLLSLGLRDVDGVSPGPSPAFRARFFYFFARMPFLPEDVQLVAESLGRDFHSSLNINIAYSARLPINIVVPAALSGRACGDAILKSATCLSEEALQEQVGLNQPVVLSPAHPGLHGYPLDFRLNKDAPLTFLDFVLGPVANSVKLNALLRGADLPENFNKSDFVSLAHANHSLVLDTVASSQRPAPCFFPETPFVLCTWPRSSRGSRNLVAFPQLAVDQVCRSLLGLELPNGTLTQFPDNVRSHTQRLVFLLSMGGYSAAEIQSTVLSAPGLCPQFFVDMGKAYTPSTGSFLPHGEMYERLMSGTKTLRQFVDSRSSDWGGVPSLSFDLSLAESSMVSCDTVHPFLPRNSSLEEWSEIAIRESYLSDQYSPPLPISVYRGDTELMIRRGIVLPRRFPAGSPAGSPPTSPSDDSDDNGHQHGTLPGGHPPPPGSGSHSDSNTAPAPAATSDDNATTGPQDQAVESEPASPAGHDAQQSEAASDDEASDASSDSASSSSDSENDDQFPGKQAPSPQVIQDLSELMDIDSQDDPATSPLRSDRARSPSQANSPQPHEADEHSDSMDVDPSEEPGLSSPFLGPDQVSSPLNPSSQASSPITPVATKTVVVAPSAAQLPTPGPSPENKRRFWAATEAPGNVTAKRARHSSPEAGVDFPGGDLIAPAVLALQSYRSPSPTPRPASPAGDVDFQSPRSGVADSDSDDQSQHSDQEDLDSANGNTAPLPSLVSWTDNSGKKRLTFYPLAAGFECSRCLRSTASAVENGELDLEAGSTPSRSPTVCLLVTADGQFRPGCDRGFTKTGQKVHSCTNCRFLTPTSPKLAPFVLQLLTQLQSAAQWTPDMSGTLVFLGVALALPDSPHLWTLVADYTPPFWAQEASLLPAGDGSGSSLFCVADLGTALALDAEPDFCSSAPSARSAIPHARVRHPALVGAGRVLIPSLKKLSLEEALDPERPALHWDVPGFAFPLQKVWLKDPVTGLPKLARVKAGYVLLTAPFACSNCLNKRQFCPVRLVDLVGTVEGGKALKVGVCGHCGTGELNSSCSSSVERGYLEGRNARLSRLVLRFAWFLRCHPRLSDDVKASLEDWLRFLLGLFSGSPTDSLQSTDAGYIFSLPALPADAGEDWVSELESWSSAPWVTDPLPAELPCPGLLPHSDRLDWRGGPTARAILTHYASQGLDTPANVGSGSGYSVKPVLEVTEFIEAGPADLHARDSPVRASVPSDQWEFP